MTFKPGDTVMVVPNWGISLTIGVNADNFDALVASDSVVLVLERAA